ncbi:MAG: tetratricopeptide repeat protein [Blastocatellia bacterium]|nr:tetratricopeptide repeat protein [Blastocatellia bacterium]MCS7157871.1 tetratricopeptide repeat protein [Blastocatellia bacterium]MCX7753392.1 tetratricopeptide repeat protein [Blastocatellia bacterium]MDW8168051.1 tetratricopeptide repeat protein [Acidobacteriota bacterium]MDW8257700.1 tetratricopeptide repeat protein [Acidobacteriota bacterium]
MKKRGLIIAIAIFIGILALLGITQGPDFYRMVKAKDRLNNGAVAYERGDYDEAIRLFKEAVDLYPNMEQARLYYAAGLFAKFNLTNEKPLALEAMKIYEDVYQKNPNSADAIAYLAVIHKNLADLAETEEEREQHMEKYREWTLKRLDLPGLDNKAKAEIYYTLGQGYWQESFQITQPYQVNRPPQPVTWNVPESEVPKVKALVQKGMEYLNKAVELNPEYGDAWAYINLLYREQAKVEKDPKVRAELTRLADQARDRAMELYKRREEQQKQQQAQKST